MRINRGLCAFLTIGLLFVGVFTAQQVWAGYFEFRCGDGSYHSSCQDYGGYECQDGKVVDIMSKCIERGGTVARVVSLCGDGEVDVGELCDNGTSNSDTQPNACRTDCRSAYCGDSVVDTGEECDDGGSNRNEPNSCRPDCTLPVCGDGIHDGGSHGFTVFNEECDDGNANNLDGCKTDCSTCLRLTNNIDVTADTKLCGDVFNVPDYGDEGVIIVKFPGVTIDCDGATLQGSGVGAGIFVKMSNDVTIRNCTISGYAVGVKAVDSQGLKVELGNNFNNNGQAYMMENSTRVFTKTQLGVTGLPVSAGDLQGLAPGVPSADYTQKKPRRGLPAPGSDPAALKPVVKPGTLVAKFPAAPPAPVIIYPRSGQAFPALAAFTAKVGGKSRERLVFTVKNVGGKRYLKQSNNGRFAGIPAGDYCVEAAHLKTPGSPGPCVRFKVTGPPAKPAQVRAAAPVAPALPAKPAAPAKPLIAAPSPTPPGPTVSKTMMVVVPKGTVVTEGKRIFLNMNVAVVRVEVYAGTRRLGQLPGGKRFEITSYVPKALKGELIFHYFDARGVKTIQKVQVSSSRR